MLFESEIKESVSYKKSFPIAYIFKEHFKVAIN